MVVSEQRRQVTNSFCSRHRSSSAIRDHRCIVMHQCNVNHDTPGMNRIRRCNTTTALNNSIIGCERNESSTRQNFGHDGFAERYKIAPKQYKDSLLPLLLCWEATTPAIVTRIQQFADRSRHTATGTHVPYGITQCYLPPGRGDIPLWACYR